MKKNKYFLMLFLFLIVSFYNQTIFAKSSAKYNSNPKKVSVLPFKYFITTQINDERWEKNIIPYKDRIIWKDIQMNDYELLIAITEEEGKTFSKQQQNAVITKRADLICQWTGYNKSLKGSVKINQGRCHFYIAPWWVLKSVTDGEKPSFADLDKVIVPRNITVLIVKDKSLSCKKLGYCEDDKIWYSCPKDPLATRAFLKITCVN